MPLLTAPSAFGLPKFYSTALSTPLSYYDNNDRLTAFDPEKPG